MFWIEISSGPNSSPAKSLFSTVPFRAQIAQIPNSPPTQAKFESPLVSSLSPPFPTSVPDDDDKDDGRASPPHRSYLIYALVHRTGWSTDNVGHRNRRASQTPSSTASGALHRHRLPAHRATSPSTSSHLRPPRPLGLHQRSRPPHRSAPLPLKICIRARPANASASPSTALK